MTLEEKARLIPDTDVERTGEDDWVVCSQDERKKDKYYSTYFVCTDRSHRGSLCTCYDSYQKMVRGQPTDCKHSYRCDLSLKGELGYIDRRRED